MKKRRWFPPTVQSRAEIICSLSWIGCGLTECLRWLKCGTALVCVWNFISAAENVSVWGQLKWPIGPFWSLIFQFDHACLCYVSLSSNVLTLIPADSIPASASPFCLSCEGSDFCETDYRWEITALPGHFSIFSCVSCSGECVIFHCCSMMNRGGLWEDRGGLQRSQDGG